MRGKSCGSLCWESPRALGSGQSSVKHRPWREGPKGKGAFTAATGPTGAVNKEILPRRTHLCLVLTPNTRSLHEIIQVAHTCETCSYSSFSKSSHQAKHRIFLLAFLKNRAVFYLPEHFKLYLISFECGVKIFLILCGRKIQNVLRLNTEGRSHQV